GNHVEPVVSESPLLGKGGVDAPSKKFSRRYLIWRGRGGSFKPQTIFLTSTTPSAPLLEAARYPLALRAKVASRPSQHFLDGAAVPSSAEEVAAPGLS